MVQPKGKGEHVPNRYFANRRKREYARPWGRGRESPEKHLCTLLTILPWGSYKTPHSMGRRLLEEVGKRDSPARLLVLRGEKGPGFEQRRRKIHGGKEGKKRGDIP